MERCIFYTSIGQRCPLQYRIIADYACFLGNPQFIVNTIQLGRDRLVPAEGSGVRSADLIEDGKSFRCMLMPDDGFDYFVASDPSIEESVCLELLGRVKSVFNKEHRYDILRVLRKDYNDRLGPTLKDLVINFNKGIYDADFKFPRMLTDDNVALPDPAFNFFAYVAKGALFLVEYTDWTGPFDDFLKIRSATCDLPLNGFADGFNESELSLGQIGDCFCRDGFAAETLAQEMGDLDDDKDYYFSPMRSDGDKADSSSTGSFRKFSDDEDPFQDPPSGSDEGGIY